jgi:hypothetical protein
MVVTQPHYDYCQIGEATFHLDFKKDILVGYHKHHDFEHGHEKWVEVVS